MSGSRPSGRWAPSVRSTLGERIAEGGADGLLSATRTPPQQWALSLATTAGIAGARGRENSLPAPLAYPCDFDILPRAPSFVADVRTAGLAIRKQLVIVHASSAHEIDKVFVALSQNPVDALMVGPAALTNNRRVQLATLAAYHRVSAIYTFRENVDAGGLMSYGTRITDAHRQAGVYAGRTLKGEKPTDLPVLQSTKFEFVINLNTARAFGITFPPGLLAIADEVIE